MLATENNVVRTLRKGRWTLDMIYAECERRADTARDGGHDPVPGHAGDQRWKRRVRGDLQTLRRQGRARRIGRTAWAIRGTLQEPRLALLIIAGATPAEFELRLQAAARLLAELDKPAAFIFADPPYGLGRGEGRHFADGNGYRRDCSKIVPGYVDVEPARYAEFTEEWIQAAAGALRPGGQLAVITGPQRTGVIQCAAQQAGLTWVTTIAAGRVFPVRTVRRPAPAHWDISVLVKGALMHPRRVFNAPQDLPKAHSGGLYPLDWWPAEYNGRSDRRGLVRYDNSLPLRMVLRVVRMLTDPGEHVADPFLGGGTTAVACWLASRQFTGGDVNPGAVGFTAARLLDEHAWPADKAPALFPRPA